MKWAEEQKKLMKDQGDNFHCAFLDEKWFYTTSRRRKIKILPAGKDEDPEKVKPKQPRCISRRYPIKVCLFVYCASCVCVSVHGCVHLLNVCSISGVKF